MKGFFKALIFYVAILYSQTLLIQGKPTLSFGIALVSVLILGKCLEKRDEE